MTAVLVYGSHTLAVIPWYECHTRSDILYNNGSMTDKGIAVIPRVCLSYPPWYDRKSGAVLGFKQANAQVHTLFYYRPRIAL